jgi:hypothetical protein
MAPVLALDETGQAWGRTRTPLSTFFSLMSPLYISSEETREITLQENVEKRILSVMKLANFVTKLQDVFRPNEEEAESIHAVRKGKRLLIPADDLARLHRYQRKRVVQVTYTGPKKLTCRQCGTPFLSLADGRGRYPEYPSNACKQKAYRERKKAAAK